MRKRRLFLVAGACAAALSLAVGSVAFADPANPPGPRLHPATGSNTTQDVMNGFANGFTFTGVSFGGITDGAGNKVLASYDAVGTLPVTYRNAPATCVNVNIRPNGSTEGVNALRGLTPPAGPFPQECVDWARSSSNSAPSRPGQNLRFIPFAVDGLTYATLGTSSVAKNLSTATLGSIYRLNVGDALCDNNLANGEFKPILPQAGSGTRRDWLSLIGVTEAQVGTCVNSTLPAAPEEHDCRQLSLPQQLVPFGVSQYIIQTQQPSVTNRAGNCQLRAIAGKYSTEVKTDHPGSRTVYNVIKGENAPGGATPLPELIEAFVGAGSDVCSRPEVIQAYGLKTIPAGDPNPCGSQISTP